MGHVLLRFVKIKVSKLIFKLVHLIWPLFELSYHLLVGVILVALLKLLVLRGLIELLLLLLLIRFEFM